MPFCRLTRVRAPQLFKYDDLGHRGSSVNFSLALLAKSPAYEPLVKRMRGNQPYVRIGRDIKTQGSFRRNYGKLIGAYLYLRSIGAARGRFSLWSSLWFAIVSVGAAWLEKHCPI